MLGVASPLHFGLRDMMECSQAEIPRFHIEVPESPVKTPNTNVSVKRGVDWAYAPPLRPEATAGKDRALELYSGLMTCGAYRQRS
jgi:hypothetical protein